MDYLACSLSFEAGNVSRPDIVNNCTLAEYKSWRTVVDFVTQNGLIAVAANDLPPLRVSIIIYFCTTTYSLEIMSGDVD
jgi:hypothetical protein